MKNIPFLFNSFAKRKHFIDVCFHFYGKYFSDRNFYLTIDDKNFHIDESLNINILHYDTIQSTSEHHFQCLSRYYRQLNSLNYLKSIGYVYVTSCMDDGWIDGDKINWDSYGKCLTYLQEYNVDRIDLCGPQPRYNLIKIKNDLNMVDSNNDLPWYLTNQCSIWKIDSLLTIYKILGPVSDCDVERQGSEISRRLQYKFLTFDNQILGNDGVFQRTVGFNHTGIKLLKEYCYTKNLDYNEEIKKFGI